MSQLKANIQNIQSINSLTLLTLICKEQKLTMISLELDSKVQVGKNVILACKPTSVALAKIDIEQNSLSYSNQLKVKVEKLDRGQLLCSLALSFGEFNLESIVTTNSIVKMQVKEGDELLALIKANELSIVEVLND